MLISISCHYFIYQSIISTLMIFYPLLHCIGIILFMLLSLFISPYLRSILRSLCMGGILVEWQRGRIMTCPLRSILVNVSERKIPNLTLFIRCCKSSCFLLVFILLLIAIPYAYFSFLFQLN